MNASGAVGGEEEGDGAAAPRARVDLVGHERAQKIMRASIDRGQVHHAWLIAGARGLGKTTLAFRFARALLAPDALDRAGGLHIPPEHRTFKQIAAGSHSDLMTLSRVWDEKKKKFAADLSVDQIRRLGGFFALTSAQGGRRVAIIDAADDMNKNAANALLKLLEEPPSGGVLIVICHALGALLPTLRSRCLLTRLGPVSDRETAQFLMDEGACASQDEAGAIARLSNGAPGAALRMARAGGRSAYERAIGFLIAAGAGRWSEVREHAEDYARPANEAAFVLWSDLVLKAAARTASAALTSDDQAGLAAAEKELARAVAQAGAAARMADAHASIAKLLREARAVNLDRKQTIMDMAGAIHRAAGS